MFKTALTLYSLISISNPFTQADVANMAEPSVIEAKADSRKILASKSFSLAKRHSNEFVNGVFRDNILLTLNYLSGSVQNKQEINWEKINKPGNFQFILKPGETFAFHDQIRPETVKVVKTANAHFNYQEGFKSDGHLVGDGVCHLASLIYWAAKEAGVTAIAPTNHDFAMINEVPREFGVSIYSVPGSNNISARQNLYITNNLDKLLIFDFKYDGTNLTVKVIKSNL